MSGGEYRYDLAVIGAGPGGYVGAIRAAQLGLRVILVERDRPGGVCLNVGCIPSKALIHQAGVFRSADALREMGVKIDASGLDYGAVFRASRRAAERLSKGVEFLIKKNKIDYIKGTAALSTPHQLTIDGAQGPSARAVLLATGSRPRVIPGFEFDERIVLSSTGALMLERLPRRLLILGAGAIGMEFAYIMSSFGVQVTVVEMLDRALPMEDAETAAVVEKEFRKRGVEILTSSRALGWEKKEQGVVVTVERTGEGTARTAENRHIETDLVLVAVGRTPNSQGLNLERLGVVLDKGFVGVGDYYETAVSGVYAVGDLISTPLLAHLASKEAEIAVERMAGLAPEPRVDPDLVPSAVYCEPQIGSFGLSEERAVKLGLAYEKAVFPYRGVGKAVAVGNPEGLVKILYRPGSREILGAHVVGADATELIHELLLAKAAELLPRDIAAMIHAHPTLSEGIMEAARAVEGWAIHG